jgi:RNA polymerase sigma-70 factor (ECF subfamily)
VATVGRWRRSSTSIASGSGAWWSCASTRGFEAGSMRRTSSRRRSSTSTATLDAYLADPKLPPLIWLRLHVGRRLTTLHRRHLGTRMRDAGLEISLYQGALPEASSAAPASMLLGRQTSPTQAAQRAERMLRVQEALNSLDPIDREVLALRHFEQLGRAEAAQVLGITQEAAAKRYFRALKRLKDVLATVSGGGEGL